MQGSTLTSVGGEFQSPQQEADFQTERLPETLRHARILFLLSVILNSLFFISDWRFFGQPHFYAAIPARAIVVAVSLGCLLVASRACTFETTQWVVRVWQWVTAGAVAILVSSHSDIALFVVVMLPSIYYLVVPASFRWTMISGVGCSAMMLAGYLQPASQHETAIGLVLAMLVLNVALSLVVSRSNRLRRLEWAATRAERRANQELADSRKLFEDMFMAVPIPLMVTEASNGRLINFNDAARSFFGADPLDHGITSICDVYVDPSERTALLARLRREGHVSNHEASIRLADGSVRSVLLAATASEIGGADRVITGAVDITSRKAAEERVWRAASHDSLTGLPNRALFQSRLESALARAERARTCVSLLLIDLDDFKEVNDTLGHDAGDALLQETATRLQATVREGDTVARLGGDEFVVVVRDPLKLADALSLAETILGEMRRPFAYKDHLLSGRASIGIAAYPDHDTNPGELMKDADLALYAAKGKGRNRACVYHPAMRDAMQRRVLLARELQEAVAGDQIVPFYQPKICLSTGAIVGFEALARWRHPCQGVLTPDHFASGFQDPELAVVLGEQMLARIAGDMRDWAARGLSFGRVAINLSAAQFAQADLAGRFFAILEAQGANPRHFDVEVTETVFLGKSSDYVAAALEEFHQRGVRIALDDFGTGYASLAHLKQFPVDDIKIDQSFVRDIEHDAGDRAIVSAVIDLGRNLGLQVIAEGVETEGQARYLLARGCNYAQGFLYAKPMIASRVPWFLTECAPGLLRACPDLQMTAW